MLELDKFALDTAASLHFAEMGLVWPGLDGQDSDVSTQLPEDAMFASKSQKSASSAAIAESVVEPAPLLLQQKAEEAAATSQQLQLTAQVPPASQEKATPVPPTSAPPAKPTAPLVPLPPGSPAGNPRKQFRSSRIHNTSIGEPPALPPAVIPGKRPAAFGRVPEPFASDIAADPGGSRSLSARSIRPSSTLRPLAPVKPPSMGRAKLQHAKRTDPVASVPPSKPPPPQQQGMKSVMSPPFVSRSFQESPAETSRRSPRGKPNPGLHLPALRP